MPNIDDRIRNIDSVICRHIASADFSPRGAVAQDVLAQLRNFVEHIMLKFYAPSAEEPCTQDVFNMSRASDEHTKAFSAKRSIPDFVFAGIYQRLVQAGIAHS